MDGLNSLGCDEEIGLDFGYGTLFKTAGGIAEGAIASKEEDDAKQKSEKEESDAVTAAVAADIAAANAQARSDTSAQLKSSSADVDAQAAQIAFDAQDKTGAALSESGAKKRGAAADKQLANAIKNAQAAPKDGYKAALVKAWTATVNKAHNTSITSSGKGKKGDKSGGSFWTRRVLGPIPGYGVVAGGTAVAGGLGYAIKRIFFK
jgi:hypothetical protein